MGILSAICVLLIIFTIYRIHVLVNESASVEKNKSLLAEQKAFADDLLKRGNAAQEDADRKLALAKEKYEAAETAPQRAALLVEQAKEERKKVEEERRKLEEERKKASEQAKKEQEQSQLALEVIAQKREQLRKAEKEIQQAKDEADVAKVKADDALKEAKQARLEAASLKAQSQEKENKAMEAVKEATQKFQQAEKAARNASETLKRIEASPGLKALFSKMSSKVSAERKDAALLLGTARK
jgi:colicin import membrane protein